MAEGAGTRNAGSKTAFVWRVETSFVVPERRPAHLDWNLHSSIVPTQKQKQRSRTFAHSFAAAHQLAP